MLHEQRTGRLKSISAVWLLCLHLHFWPEVNGVFLADTKAVLQSCGDRWTFSGPSSIPVLVQTTVCVDVQILSSGAWTAFSYMSPPAPHYVLALQGDENALYAWLYGVRHQFPVQLTLRHWHRLCLQWDVPRKTFRLTVLGSPEAHQRTAIASAIPPLGRLVLGCGPKEAAAGVKMANMELYLFRMWDDTGEHRPCEDGTVVGWDSKLWTVTRPQARLQDLSLQCGVEHLRVKRSVTDSLNPLPTDAAKDISSGLLYSTVASVVNNIQNLNPGLNISSQGSTATNSLFTQPTTTVTASSKSSTVYGLNTTTSLSTFSATVSSLAATHVSATERNPAAPSTGGTSPTLAIRSPSISGLTLSDSHVTSAAEITTNQITARSSVLITYGAANHTAILRTVSANELFTNAESFVAPCDFSQSCANTSSFYWMLMEISSSNLTEESVKIWFSDRFNMSRCFAEGINSTSCQSDLVLVDAEVQCQGQQNVPVSNCSVLLQLREPVKPCDLHRLLENSSGDAGVQVQLLRPVEPVGKGFCPEQDLPLSSGGRTVYCVSLLTMSRLCETPGPFNVTCSYNETDFVPNDFMDNSSCSVTTQTDCECQVSTNNMTYYALLLNISRPDVNVLSVQSEILQLRSPCNGSNLLGSLCDHISDIAELFQGMHLECSGEGSRLESCTLVLQLTATLRICDITAALTAAWSNSSSFVFDGRVTRTAVCGLPTLSENLLLSSTLTWISVNLQPSNYKQIQSLLRCEHNQTFAVLLNESCFTPSDTSPPMSSQTSGSLDMAGLIDSDSPDTSINISISAAMTSVNFSSTDILNHSSRSLGVLHPTPSQMLSNVSSLSSTQQPADNSMFNTTSQIQFNSTSQYITHNTTSTTNTFHKTTLSTATSLSASSWLTTPQITSHDSDLNTNITELPQDITDMQRNASVTYVYSPSTPLNTTVLSQNLSLSGNTENPTHTASLDTSSTQPSDTTSNFTIRPITKASALSDAASKRSDDSKLTSVNGINAAAITITDIDTTVTYQNHTLKFMNTTVSSSSLSDNSSKVQANKDLLNTTILPVIPLIISQPSITVSSRLVTLNPEVSSSSISTAIHTNTAPVQSSFTSVSLVKNLTTLFPSLMKPITAISPLSESHTLVNATVSPGSVTELLNNTLNVTISPHGVKDVLLNATVSPLSVIHAFQNSTISPLSVTRAFVNAAVSPLSVTDVLLNSTVSFLSVTELLNATVSPLNVTGLLLNVTASPFNVTAALLSSTVSPLSVTDVLLNATVSSLSVTELLNATVSPLSVKDELLNAPVSPFSVTQLINATVSPLSVTDALQDASVSPLSVSQALLKATISPFSVTHVLLNGTVSPLRVTDVLLNATVPSLNVTELLNATVPHQDVTDLLLNATVSPLNETKALLTATVPPLSVTDVLLNATVSSLGVTELLNATVSPLDITDLLLNSTVSPLNETKVLLTATVPPLSLTDVLLNATVSPLSVTELKNTPVSPLGVTDVLLNATVSSLSKTELLNATFSSLSVTDLVLNATVSPFSVTNVLLNATVSSLSGTELLNGTVSSLSGTEVLNATLSSLSVTDVLLNSTVSLVSVTEVLNNTVSPFSGSQPSLNATVSTFSETDKLLNSTVSLLDVRDVLLNATVLPFSVTDVLLNASVSSLSGTELLNATISPFSVTNVLLNASVSSLSGTELLNATISPLSVTDIPSNTTVSPLSETDVFLNSTVSLVSVTEVLNNTVSPFSVSQPSLNATVSTFSETDKLLNSTVSLLDVRDVLLNATVLPFSVTDVLLNASVSSLSGTELLNATISPFSVTDVLLNASVSLLGVRDVLLNATVSHFSVTDVLLNASVSLLGVRDVLLNTTVSPFSVTDVLLNASVSSLSGTELLNATISPLSVTDIPSNAQTDVFQNSTVSLVSVTEVLNNTVSPLSVTQPSLNATVSTFSETDKLLNSTVSLLDVRDVLLNATVLPICVTDVLLNASVSSLSGTELLNATISLFSVTDVLLNASVSLLGVRDVLLNATVSHFSVTDVLLNASVSLLGVRDVLLNTTVSPFSVTDVLLNASVSSLSGTELLNATISPLSVTDIPSNATVSPLSETDVFQNSTVSLVSVTEVLNNTVSPLSVTQPSLNVTVLPFSKTDKLLNSTVSLLGVRDGLLNATMSPIRVTNALRDATVSPFSVTHALLNATNSPLSATHGLSNTRVTPLSVTDELLNATVSPLDVTDLLLNTTVSPLNLTDALLNITVSSLSETDLLLNSTVTHLSVTELLNATVSRLSVTEVLLNATVSPLSVTELLNATVSPLSVTEVLLNATDSTLSLIELLNATASPLSATDVVLPTTVSPFRVTEVVNATVSLLRVTELLNATVSPLSVTDVLLKNTVSPLNVTHALLSTTSSLRVTELANATVLPLNVTELLNTTVSPLSVTDVVLNATILPISLSNVLLNATVSPISLTELLNASVSPLSVTDLLPSAKVSPLSGTRNLLNDTVSPLSAKDVLLNNTPSHLSVAHALLSSTISPFRVTKLLNDTVSPLSLTHTLLNYTVAPLSVTDVLLNGTVLPLGVTELLNATVSQLNVTELLNATVSLLNVTDALLNATESPFSVTELLNSTASPLSVTDLLNAAVSSLSVKKLQNATVLPLSAKELLKTTASSLIVKELLNATVSSLGVKELLSATASKLSITHTLLNYTVSLFNVTEVLNDTVSPLIVTHALLNASVSSFGVSHALLNATVSSLNVTHALSSDIVTDAFLNSTPSMSTDTSGNSNARTEIESLNTSSISTAVSSTTAASDSKVTLVNGVSATDDLLNTTVTSVAFNFNHTTLPVSTAPDSGTVSPLVKQTFNTTQKTIISAINTSTPDTAFSNRTTTNTTARHHRLYNSTEPLNTSSSSLSIRNMTTSATHAQRDNETLLQNNLTDRSFTITATPQYNSTTTDHNQSFHKNMTQFNLTIAFPSTLYNRTSPGPFMADRENSTFGTTSLHQFNTTQPHNATDYFITDANYTMGITVSQLIPTGPVENPTLPLTSATRHTQTASFTVTDLPEVTDSDAPTLRNISETPNATHPNNTASRSVHPTALSLSANNTAETNTTTQTPLGSTQRTHTDATMTSNSTAAVFLQNLQTSSRHSPTPTAQTSHRYTTASSTRSTETTTTASTENPESLASDILNQTKDVEFLNSTQVNELVSQLENLISAPNISMDLARTVLSIINSFLNVSADTLGTSSNRLIKAVDSLGLKLVLQEQTETIALESLSLAVTKADGGSFASTSFSVEDPLNPQVTSGVGRKARAVQSSTSLGRITLPASLTEDLSPEEQSAVSRVQFTFFQKSTFFQDKSLSGELLNSYIIGSSVANLSIQNLRENVEFTLKNIQTVGNYVVSCVFWDFDKNGGSGGWNPSGCFLQNSSTENETVCSCNHLTSFAVLMDISRTDITDRLQATILTFITYIGCGLSAVFLSVTLLTYLSFDKLRRDIPSKILIHLCSGLLLLNMVFLLDSWLALYQEAVGLCISTAFFLHYFLLVSFTWMGLEALHMYIAIVKVFNNYMSRYMLKFSLAGWGVPLVVVIVVIAVNKNNYGLVTYGRYSDGSSDDFCWLKNDIAFYVAVVAYFCVVFLLNVVMFVVVMVHLQRIKRQNPHNNQYRSGLHDLRSIAGLSFLLGLTWGFAFFAWGPVNLAFMYLFSIFNSLQGFFIFLFHCALKENVRRQWRTYLCCGKLRLAENSEWSRTATHNTKKTSILTASSSTSGNHGGTRSSVSSDESVPSQGFGSPLEDSQITAGESADDVVLNELNRQLRLRSV